MKHFIVSILFTAFASFSFGQTPSPVSTQEKSRVKNFGSSLKRFEKSERRKSKDRQIVILANDDVIKVKTDLVLSEVLITDQKGNVISGLEKGDFIISEDGNPQTVEIFSRGERATIPRSVVLVLDCQTPEGPYLKYSIAAAKLLVDKLGSNDKMAIVTVDLKLRQDFTQDKIHLKKVLDSLEKQGPEVWGGWEFTTLLAVLNEMFDEDGRQRIIFFQGDGTEIIWLKPDKDAPYPVSYSTLERSGLKYVNDKFLPKFGFSDVREALERSNVTVYSIIPGIRFLGFSKQEQLARAKVTWAELHRFNGWNEKKEIPAILKEYQRAEAERKTAGQTGMFRVAELSGGNTGFIEKPEDAQNIYSEIFTIIENRYVLGYYPSDRTQGEKTRTIKVEVRGHPEYIVTGRKTYITQ